MEHNSFWQLEKAPEFTHLQGDLHTNVVIVGAGMCGLLSAYLLIRKGVTDITILDANEICSGVTAGTTGKITSQHGLIYAKLLQGMGREAAAQYAAANEKAIRQFQEIVAREGIDCDFTAANAWVYCLMEDKLQDIEDEVQAARQLGIEAAFETDTELPFPIKGAIRFPDQAHFHPLKFAFSLCSILVKAGCKIYTDTKAAGAEEGMVYTDKGSIRAQHIICCSHYPFIDKHSLIFTKVYQERSYALALKGAGRIQDMYLDCAEGGYSFRPQKDERGEDLILFSAYDHKSGHESKQLHYDGLLQEAAKNYPSGSPAYMWSAQDCMTHDKIPHIGRYHTLGDNIYLATGFNKWGMTSSMAAAEIISDMITKGTAENASVFSMDRQDMKLQVKSFVRETVDIVGNFLTRQTLADESLRAIDRNQGGIVEVEGKRVGVYRDADGRLHAVKPVCTHMGCAIKWNRDENTWDCTCHGSRFDYQGNVMGGPALTPLERCEIEEDRVENNRETAV